VINPFAYEDDHAFDEVKPYLVDYLNEIATLKGKKYICPLCGSGTGKNGTPAFSIVPHSNDTAFICYKCGNKGTIIDLYGYVNSIDPKTKDGKKQIITVLKEKYIRGGSVPMKKPKSYTPPQPTQEELDYKEFEKKEVAHILAEAPRHLLECNYLYRRGISWETQKAFNVGYIPNFIHPKTKWQHRNEPQWNYYTSPRVIIPTSSGSLVGRAVNPKENLRYAKIGDTHVFNPQALMGGKLQESYCYVFEGEVDTLSAIECGYNAVGLGSTSMIDKLFKEYTINKDVVLILALDNDEGGKNATPKAIELCKQHQQPYIVADSNQLFGGAKDCNQALQNDRIALTNALQKEFENAKSLDIEAYRKECEALEEERQQQPELTSEDYFGKSYAYNDIGRVERLKAVANKQYRYCNQLNSWYIYNHKLGVLELNQDNTFKGVLHRRLDANFSSELEALQQRGSSDDKINRSLVRELEKEHKSAISMRNFNTVLERLTWEKDIAILVGNIDRPKLLNLKDVTINLETLEEHPHNIENLCTKFVDAEFNAPLEPWAVKLWEDFVNSIMVTVDDNGNLVTDPELVEFLQRVCGYILEPTNKEECFFIFYGSTTRNGKSTLISALQGVLGDYSKAVSSTTLAETKPSDTGKPEILALKGSKLLVCGELSSETLLNDTLLKSALGRDTICVRALYSNDMVQFVIDGKIFVNCNEYPPMRNDDLLVSNRLIPIPFKRHFEEHEQNKNLKQQLSQPEVKNAILHWLWDGYKRYLEKGIKADMPQAVLDEIEHYESIATSVNMFLNSDDIFEKLDKHNIEKSTSVNVTTVKHMYNRYKDFCFDNGMRAVSLKSFKSDIERNRHYKAKKQKDGKAYYRVLWGLKLRPLVNSIDDVPTSTTDQGERMAEKYQKVRYKDYK
jgi:P4 family phage/plasmid primase-like protien